MLFHWLDAGESVILKKKKNKDTTLTLSSYAWLAVIARSEHWHQCKCGNWERFIQVANLQ